MVKTRIHTQPDQIALDPQSMMRDWDGALLRIFWMALAAANISGSHFEGLRPYNTIAEKTASCSMAGCAWREGECVRRGLLRLRGGASKWEAMLAADELLMDEIRHDAQRMEEGKVPLFIERLGEDDVTKTGNYEILNGVEADMPAPIGAGEDEDMGISRRIEIIEPALDLSWVGNETEEHRQERYAEEAEAAKQHFEEIDAKYYTQPDEKVEDFWGHRGMWQKRVYDDEDYQDYFEAREAAHGLDKFLKAIPPHLKDGSPELAKWLDDYGWNECILRNGTRIKWTPELRMNEGGMTVIPGFEDEIHDELWFRETTMRIIFDAWTRPEEDYWKLFRTMNSTFDELASMHVLLNDSYVLDLREELEELAGDDQRKNDAMEEFWDLCLIKWNEFYQGPEYNGEIVEALDEIERVRLERFGPPEYSKYWAEPREINWYGDVSSD